MWQRVEGTRGVAAHAPWGQSQGMLPACMIEAPASRQGKHHACMHAARERGSGSEEADRHYILLHPAPATIAVTGRASHTRGVVWCDGAPPNNTLPAQLILVLDP